MTQDLDLIYKGWIPTASERLSYSLIGESKHPKSAISRNVADQCSRRIISCQHRPDLLDSAIPFFKRSLVRFFSDIASDFWFICIARCDTENAHAPLKGTLCLIKDTKTWKRSIRPAIQTIFDELDQFLVLKDGNPSIVLDSYVKENNIDDQIKNVESQSLYSVQFSLERNGVVTIFPSSYTVNEDFSADTESCRKDIHENRLNQDAVCAQLFYFLKDIAHIHQHHRPTTDTLTGLYPKLLDESALAWINKTLKTLYSKVLEYKRDRHEDSYASNLGLLAYVDSFVKIAKKSLADEENNKLILRNHDTLKASIYASQLGHQADSNRRVKFFDGMKSLFFSIVGVLIATAGLGNLIKGHIKINIPDGFNLVEFLANAIINYPLQSLSAILLTIISLPLVSSGVFNFYLFRWVKDIATIFIMLLKSRLYAAILSIFLALSVLILSIYLYLKVPKIADWLTSLLSIVNF